MKRYIMILVIAMLFTSCMTTKTTVGAFREAEGPEYTYAKSKQIWFFWGLLPLGRSDTPTPADGSCRIISRNNAVDILISTFTAGLVISRTIKVRAKK